MKTKLTLLIAILLTNYGFTQENVFNHCDCTEILTEDSYKVTSKGIEVESGQFESGKRSGTWISKNNKGTIIREANYLNGNLNGEYKLFHYDGKIKLSASFNNGTPSGTWVYYNSKGKIIKQGSYSNGEPTGTWKIFDKKGKKTYAEYNFDSNTEIISAKGKRYFDRGGIARDDQSGEWMVLYFPARNITVKTQPLGGYMLASDIFVDHFIIPTILMNTYVHLEYTAKLKLENGVVSLVSVDRLEKRGAFNISSHSLPFMVDTNSPNKLSRIEISDATLEFLKGQLAEFIIISAPWIGNTDEVVEFTIQSPIVINEVKKW